MRKLRVVIFSHFIKKYKLFHHYTLQEITALLDESVLLTFLILFRTSLTDLTELILNSMPQFVVGKFS